MPMHTSTITGVVQDIVLSLDDVVQAADRPPLNTIYGRGCRPTSGFV
jgi:hypothetical protein